MKKLLLSLILVLSIGYVQAQILLPNRTTTERNALVGVQTGTTLFNNTINSFDVYNGSTWNSFGDQIIIPATNTAAETTGARTINKISGTVNIAAGDSVIVITNSKVSTASLVIPIIRTNDATARIKSAVPTNGSVTIRTTPVTAETSIGFIVIN
jgi:uncharacterized Zn ribbon protein